MDRLAPRTPFSRDLLRGAIWGAALGGFALVVGLVRFLFFLVRGGTAQSMSWSDVAPMLLYVAAFALAGLVAALIRRYVRGSGGTYVGLSAGGALAMNVIDLADGLAGRDGSDWIAMTVIGALFGLVIAHMMERG